MYAKSAAYYDAVCAASGKDYARESEHLHALIRQHKRSPGQALLDVACGTGSHLAYLRQWYEVEGLDLDPAMLAIAYAMTVPRLEQTLRTFASHTQPGGVVVVESFTERHDLALFTYEEHLGAFRAAGLDVTYDPEGLMGRGLYIGARPG